MKIRLRLLGAPLVIALFMISGLLYVNRSTTQIVAAVALPAGALDTGPPQLSRVAGRPADEDSVPQEPGDDVLELVLTKTVGTVADECATTGELAVWEGTQVFYCYTAQNMGNVTLTTHSLADSDLGLLMEEVTQELAPGASLVVTAPHTAQVTATNVATWTAATATDLTTTATGTAHLWVTPYQPGLVLTKTVGTASGACAATDELAVWEGTPVFYCYTAQNTGNVTLTTHSLVDSQLGLLMDGAAHELAPGATLVVTAPHTAQITATNVATWTAATATGLTTTATGTAHLWVTPYQPGLVLAKTVGMAAGECAATGEITVWEGTPVFYCYTARNTGNVTLTTHSLVDDRLGLLVDGAAHELAPGATLVVTAPHTAQITATNVATWTAATAAGRTATVTGTAQATVRVTLHRPAIVVTKTVGVEPGVCAPTRELTVPPGTTVYFCYTVTNVGTMMLPYHQLYDTELGDLLVGLPYDLAPGQSLSTVDLGLVVPAAITTTAVNDGVWTAYADDNHYAVASDRATVRTGSAALAVSKAVALDPRQCGDKTTLIVRPGAQVHYCVTLQNNGSVAFDRYVLVDPALGLWAAGALLLQPGARLTIDGRQLAALGPVTVSADITNTLFVTLTATPGGEQEGEEDTGALAGAGAGSLFTVTAQATARVLVDTDGDTVPDRIEGHGDLDGDGVPNDRDLDCDGDGYSDLVEVGCDPLQPLISGCHGVPDFLEPLVPNRWPLIAPGGQPLRCFYLPVLGR